MHPHSASRDTAVARVRESDVLLLQLSREEVRRVYLMMYRNLVDPCSANVNRNRVL